MSLALLDREALRRDMRRRRQALAPAQRQSAARGIAHVVSRMRLLRPGRRVAVYLGIRGEADLTRVIEMARRRQCLLYLPVITDIERGVMQFAPFDRDRPLKRNRFGIAEPAPRAGRYIPVFHLDLVLLPLVAVDHRGYRLGSGAGYYDRRLRHLRSHRHWRRPKLIGVAYEFQRVPRIEAQAWDVPVDAVVTERSFYPTPPRE